MSNVLTEIDSQYPYMTKNEKRLLALSLIHHKSDKNEVSRLSKLIRY